MSLRSDAVAPVMNSAHALHLMVAAISRPEGSLVWAGVL
jgi:hypothetical protein